MFGDQGLESKRWFLSEWVRTWIVSSFYTCLCLHTTPTRPPCHFWSVSVALFLDKRVQSKEERISSPLGKSKAYHRNWILACVLEPMGTCWYGLARTVGVKYHTMSKDLELEMEILQFHKSGAHCMVCSQEMTGYQRTYRWTTADLNSPWLLINLAHALSFSPLHSLSVFGELWR